jgi:hypothetical protein
VLSLKGVGTGEWDAEPFFFAAATYAEKEENCSGKTYLHGRINSVNSSR